jgi:hypothetical protein
MVNFYLIRFADSNVAARQVTALVGDQEDMAKLEEALLKKKKPRQVDDGAEIDSLMGLAKILRQNDGPIDLRVSENIKTELESAGIEFTVLATLRKP